MIKTNETWKKFFKWFLNREANKTVKNLAKTQEKVIPEIKPNIQTGFHTEDFSDLDLENCCSDALRKQQKQKSKPGVHKGIESDSHLLLHLNLVPQRTKP